ncbi:MAG TPA: epoxyqueuosine reductase QueH [bacterium]|nr:epoxyqueuosine reductase QueH [bacterium]
MNTLLLHACCAPCLTAPLERLVDKFDGRVTVFFYNPNIDTIAEHDKRLGEVERYLKARYGTTVDLIASTSDRSLFEAQVAPFADTDERGVRCTACYFLRLKRTFEEAKTLGMTHAATTLTVSPHKDARRLNAMGLGLEKRYGPTYLTGMWEYARTLELCREHGIYRQNYCGCASSMRERDERRREREHNKNKGGRP